MRAHSSSRPAVLMALCVVSIAGCKAPDEAPDAGRAATSASAAARGKIRLIDAPADGQVDDVVRTAQAKAMADRRRVVVYVGATWCEPCQRFHHAAERGELDAKFPDVDLLAFDADRDGERLITAGYKSKLIPLFALPGPDGRASGKQVEGGIKGDGAVGYIAPRLEKMLAD